MDRRLLDARLDHVEGHACAVGEERCDERRDKESGRRGGRRAGSAGQPAHWPAHGDTPKLAGRIYSRDTNAIENTNSRIPGCSTCFL